MSKHWVFDLDGTLVDSFQPYFVSLDQIFRDQGGRFEGDAMQKEALTIPLVDFFEKHLGGERVSEAHRRLRQMSNRDARGILAYSELVQSLDYLKAKGARIAVWTNRDLESAELIIEHSGLGRWVETCVSGTCVGRRKPDPEGLLRLIQEFGCEPSEVIMVGDHEHDVSAAKAVGARAVRASWHGYWEQESCTIADHQFFKAKDFENWVQMEGCP